MQLELLKPTTDAELLAWYRLVYPKLDDEVLTAWEAAFRMRRQRDRWCIFALAEAAVLVPAALAGAWWWLL